MGLYVDASVRATITAPNARLEAAKYTASTLAYLKHCLFFRIMFSYFKAKLASIHTQM